MPRGRPPIPTALKLARGNPGKRPINQDEPQPAPGLGEAPEGLAGESLAERPDFPFVFEPARVVALSDLVRDPKNRRKHNQRNLGMLEEALEKVGAARSIVIDEGGTILAGNGVAEVATKRGMDRVLVVDADGDTIVAVRRSGLTEDQKRALAIYDNRIPELAEWDVQQLKADSLAGLDLKPFFTPKELANVLGPDDAMRAGLTDPDQTPRERSTDIKPGDMFELGVHRLLCGDSTDLADVDRVVHGDKPGLMNTDPPYGVDYAAVKNGIPRSGFRDIQATRGDIVNDDLTDGAALQAFLERMIKAAVPVLSESPAFYLWHPMLTQGTFFAAAAAAADILIHRQIIWVKPHMVLTRSGQYHWRHELAFYGWIRGKPCPWYGSKSQTSVWELGESQAGRQHPTQKPVALFVPPIQNHTREGDAIYEPFSGSGSQFIAAEQTGRRCRGIEIEPRYCQVAIDRWEAFTGGKAVKVGEATAAR